MTRPGRFQIRTPLREQGEVRSYQGLDTLTGLPVLIYRFPGPPLPGVGELESDNIPGVLHSSFDGREGELVVAFAPSYQPLLAPVEASEVLPLLFDSTTALKDAAESGIIHGNLKPERFLRGGGHHLIEGYGVRWTPQASPFTAPEALAEGGYAGDVFSWAKSVEFLCGSKLPEELAPLVEAARSLDADERPLAKTLHEAVGNLVGAVMRESSAAVAPHITGVFEPYPDPYPNAVSASPRPDPPSELLQETGGDAGEEVPRTPLLTKRGQKEGLERPDSDPGFVRRLPPGATYRDGMEAESLPPAPIVLPEGEDKGVGFKMARSRRPLLLAALAASVAVLALLAFVWQRPSALNAPPPTYTVTISVVPEDLRSVTVMVVGSPPDSDMRPGDEIRNVPGQVALESGEWVLRGSYRNRVSADLRVSVPEERSATIIIPPGD